MHMSILFGTFSSGALLCACTHVAFPGFRLIRLFLSFRTCIYPTVLLMSHRRPHQECLVSLPGELCGPLGDFVRLAILNTPGRLTYFILFTYLLYCYTHVEVSCKYWTIISRDCGVVCVLFFFNPSVFISRYPGEVSFLSHEMHRQNEHRSSFDGRFSTLIVAMLYTYALFTVGKYIWQYIFKCM